MSKRKIRKSRKNITKILLFAISVLLIVLIGTGIAVFFGHLSEPAGLVVYIVTYIVIVLMLLLGMSIKLDARGHLENVAPAKVVIKCESCDKEYKRDWTHGMKLWDYCSGICGECGSQLLVICPVIEVIDE